MKDSQQASGPTSAEVVSRLVTSHQEFLRFLEARLPSRALAEEILQSAFVRSLEKAHTLQDPENAVAWFYRLLRNALIDCYRQRASERRALANEAQAPLAVSELEFRDAICQCIRPVLANLKPEYAEVLQRMDLEERPLEETARNLGITRNNLTVRLHRARLALKRELERSCRTCAAHGCLDCSCGSGSGCS